jgi:hypothetical protein
MPSQLNTALYTTVDSQAIESPIAKRWRLLADLPASQTDFATQTRVF